MTGSRLRIPAGTSLPASVRAYVLADVFPLAATEISPGARAPE